MIIPAGWSMPFFSSLVFTNTRVAGQRERQTQAYESGVSYFPRDYPSTPAYDAYEEKRATEEKADWDRKPPAKRVNFEKLGVTNPWSVDWNGLVGLPHNTSSDDASSEYVSTQRDAEAIHQAAEGKSRVGPWLLRGAELPKILDILRSRLNHGAALLSELNQVRSKRKFTVLPSTVTAGDILKGALINVKVTMLLRGSPKDLALIYVLSDEICRKWKKLMHCQKVKASLDDETSEEIEVCVYFLMAGSEFHVPVLQLATIIPEASSIIGRVTTGHYSLTRGHGFAIGSIQLTKLLELEQQSSRYVFFITITLNPGNHSLNVYF
jgi:ribonuclease P/MRP protein subunit POP1